MIFFIFLFFIFKYINIRFFIYMLINLDNRWLNKSF
jgi:hypothetical protein